MRTVKKKFLTAVLDYEFKTVYRELKPGRWQGVVRSTHIWEVDNYGRKDEQRKPEGNDSGFLWRLNSWWHVEEINGGVVMELRSVSLTRDIPGLVSFMIKPFVTSLPEETLETTLGKTRSAVLAVASQANGR